MREGYFTSRLSFLSPTLSFHLRFFCHDIRMNEEVESKDLASPDLTLHLFLS